MQLNKIFPFGVLTAMTFSTFVHATPTITFEGEVAAQTCVPSINGQENAIVLLPVVPAADLATAGATTGLTPFTISIKDCAVSTTDAMNISTRFLGQGVVAGNLANTAVTNPAANVSLQLTTTAAGTTPIILNGVTAVEGLVLPVNESATEHTFGVQYIADGAATAGKVTGVAEYTLSYL